MNRISAAFLFFITLISFTSCNKDKGYTVPKKYEFDNVNYSGPSLRLAMLAEMKAYMQSANTPGTALSATRLAAMYNNNAANAGWIGNYVNGSSLRVRTLDSQRDYIDQLVSALAAASASTQPAASGQAGVATSNDPTKRYLLNAKGVELAEVVEKAIMGACFYSQAIGVSLSPAMMNVDNETVVPGNGTEMQHNWDEAFGYLGVPVDFLFNTSGAIFWGDYINQRDDLLGCNQKIMEAFLRGRAAIDNKDYEKRDESIAIIEENWDLVAAASAISKLNDAIDGYDDLAVRAHALSEAVAFIYSLQFNPAARMDYTQILSVLATIGGDSNFLQMNFHTTTALALEQARNMLATFYDLENLADDL